MPKRIPRLVDPTALAKLQREARTWTSWPQMNVLASRSATLMGLEGIERVKYLQATGATDKYQNPRNEP